MNYNFKNKEEYRKHLYDFAEKHVGKAPVLYLESSQALETLYLLKRGWNPKDLYPCNMNPAIAAHITRKIKRRTNYEIKSVGKPIEEVVQTVGKSVQIVNLDYTSSLSHSLLDNVEKVSKFLTNGGKILSVTVLRGREPRLMRYVIKKLPPGPLADKFSPRYCGKRYKSGGKRGLGKTKIPPLSDYDASRLVFLDTAARKGSNISLTANSIYGIYKSNAGNQTMLFLSTYFYPSGTYEQLMRNHESLYNRFNELLAKKGRYKDAMKVFAEFTACDTQLHKLNEREGSICLVDHRAK